MIAAGYSSVLRKLLCKVRLRGFLPAAVLAVLWIVSVFVYVVGQSRGASPWRWAVTDGVVMVNWPSAGRWSGWGTVQWSLGIMKNADGTNRSGVWVYNFFPKATAQWDVEIRSGHVKVPIVYLAALSTLPAWAGVWLRHRRVPVGHCPKCRYDLRGCAGVVCPECGHAEQETGQG